MRSLRSDISGLCQILIAAVLTCTFPVTPAAAEPQLPAGLQLTTPAVPIELVGSLKTLNEQLSANLKPVDNAVIYLAVVYGPEIFEPELKRDNMEAIGLKALPADSPLFVPLEEFARTLEGVTTETAFEVALEIQSELFMAGELEWTKETYPRLEKYLAANDAAMKMATVAASKSRYYAPLLSIETPPRLMAVALNVERRLPYLARLFAARAILNFNSNHFSACLNDLSTCHRLAHLLATGSPLDVSVAKAHVLDAIACRAEEVLLSSGKLTAEQVQSLSAFNRTLPPLPPAERAIDIGERAIVHQEIELLSTDKDSVEGFFEEAGGKKTAETPDLSKLQWTLALQRADEIWNQIVQAVGNSNRQEQTEQFTKLDQAYEKWKADDDADPTKFGHILGADARAASRLVGENMAMSLKPLWWQRRATDDRAHVRHHLVAIGIALKAYQLEQGEFPESLDTLAPKYLAAIPLDAYSEAPFQYRRLAKDHAVIISFGVNLQDDAGKTYNDDHATEVR